MLTLLILENLLLIAVVYFLVTAYGINMAHLRAFILIIMDRLQDHYKDWKIERIRYIRSHCKAVIRRFKK